MDQHLTAEMLQQLLDQHASALALFASQWTTAPEDCVQEAFVELLRQPCPPDCMAAWLFRVVRNRAISMRVRQTEGNDTSRRPRRSGKVGLLRPAIR